MNILELIAFIFNGILIISLISLIYRYFHYKKINRLNERLNKSSLYIANNHDNLVDYLINHYLSLKDKLNNRLSKSKSMLDYAKKYEKYVNNRSLFMTNPMDFVTAKILCGLAIIILLVLNFALQGLFITIYHILFGFLVGFYLPDIILFSRNKYLKTRMKNDLLKAVTIMNNSFASGHSIVQTIDLTRNELNGPLRVEFDKISNDLKYGLSVEEVFNRFSKRVNIDEARYIASSLSILNKTGGNIIEVFSSIERTIFDNRRLEEELSKLASSAKFLYYVLVFIPIVFTLVIYLMDNEYFIPLITTPIGYVIIAIIVTIYVSYIVIVKNIIKIKE